MQKSIDDSKRAQGKNNQMTIAHAYLHMGNVLKDEGKEEDAF